ncbi:MAG TPA: DUF6348 family protein [Chryseolinea sp.]|nr:DUF6348 family protein [Chryseolinea sp.]
MANEIIVNSQLAGVLKNHGVHVNVDSEFVNTNLDGGLKFETRIFYHKINGRISSRLDVMAVTVTGERIIESFGDFGPTVDEAINKNFQNFSLSSLHPILAAFGCPHKETLRQVEIEEWVVKERTWKVYIGILVPKSIGPDQSVPPAQFFKSIEQEVRAQELVNKLHWFRSYYCQVNANITEREFLMDNEAKNADVIFSNVPVMANMHFYSCRNFILLKRV